MKVLLALCLYVVLRLHHGRRMDNLSAGIVTAWTFAFAEIAFAAVIRSHVEGKPISLFSEDRFWAGLWRASLSS